MTIKLLTTLALVSTVFFAAPSFAEEKNTESSKTKKTISVNQPRDAASGLPTGKREHKPVNITKPMDKASPLLVKKPAGFPTKSQGLPTGKRQHKPFSTSKELDKSSPQTAKGAYRLCPDGSMINPGEKCPEKAVRAGYKLCPDGTMISAGEKCPVKSNRGLQRK
jgi:hypothetical protein